MRAYTGRTEDGRATQVTHTLRGTKRDAQRLAAERAAKPQPRAAGRIVAAEDIDPIAVLALRIAAVAGARRSEIAALQWSDVVDGKLTIDSSVEEIRHAGRAKSFVDAPTRTGSRRVVRLDDTTLVFLDKHCAEREEASPYMFLSDGGPPPAARIGWWLGIWASPETVEGEAHSALSSEPRDEGRRSRCVEGPVGRRGPR